ncbi:DUF6082 family protein [Streptomyces sp. NBC_01304]|uniref:DUF6082 family protein n=1 Tax=Streptomyces sp. NBC_01304 TaxID=2903818 RepID=UPI002E154556|nr:DUF6082 family protein [Streptomyces sp. NBC_01304]
MPINRTAVRRRGAYLGGLGLAVLALAATPFLLDSLASPGRDWERLSNISQTYGAISVVISTVALLAVAASLVYQARQTRIQNEEAHRSTHRELMLLTLSDPAYQVCWEPPNTRMTAERWRQLLVANLIVSMWSSDYKLGLISDPGVRAVLEDYFRGEIGRAYWHNSAPSWRRYLDKSHDPRERRFVGIADEAYAAAVAAGPPVPTGEYFIP